MVPRLNGVAYRYLKNNEEINDILQDTFINIFQNIGSFKGDSKIETWATRILINNILQKFSKDKKYVLSDLESEESINISDFSHTDGNLLYQELVKLVDRLPQSKKLVFNLYVIEGYSHKEIAEMLGITESTSKTQYFRAKEILVDLHKKINNVRATA